jgi:hypothetical protein
MSIGRSPARRGAFWAYVAVAVLLTTLVAVPNVRLHRSTQPTADVLAQLRFLRGELRGGMGEHMQELFPEGYFFSHVLYGLIWIDVGTTRRDARSEALREARWALTRLDSPAGRAPFDPSLRPAYGAFYVGWSARLRGGVVSLAGPNAPEAATLSAQCAALAAELDRTGPFLTSYPGQAWPVDSVVAAAALAIRDQVLPPRHTATLSRWVARTKARLDPRTGLLPHLTQPAVEGARGSSQAIIQRFLPEIDRVWARQQYDRYRRYFVTSRLGLPVVLEYPDGQSGPGDVDSGPLILGVSASATVVGIGAARVQGDRDFAGPATGLGEAMGMPLEVSGEKRYAFGLLPIGDAFLAWSAAAASPPTGSGAPISSHPPPVQPWWRLPWNAISVLALVGLWWWPAVRLARSRRTPRETGPDLAARG